MCETCQHGCWTEIERPALGLAARRAKVGGRASRSVVSTRCWPAASQGELICSNRKPGRPAVIGAGRGRVVVVLSEIAALGEARGRDLRDQRESGDKCLHDTS